MSSSTYSSPNTSPTPNDSGRWIVTEFGTPSVMKWKPWDPAQALSDEKNVLVRIIVAGIAGVDNIQRAGGYPATITAEPGFATGYDLVGEVIALGDSVPKDCGLEVGDRVASLCRIGAHATHIVMSYKDLIRIEHTDDPIKICALPLNYMTSWGMLKRSGVELPPGSTILIGSASGGLGTAMAQLVKAFKMDIRMIGTCSPSKFDYVRSLGIEPIDRNATDLVDQVHKLTRGEGVDVSYDGVCSEESLRNLSAATKADGKVIVFGVSGSIQQVHENQILILYLGHRSWEVSQMMVARCWEMFLRFLQIDFNRRASLPSHSMSSSIESQKLRISMLLWERYELESWILLWLSCCH
jgi:NADPH2:quinone reductase